MSDRLSVQQIPVVVFFIILRLSNLRIHPDY